MAGRMRRTEVPCVQERITLHVLGRAPVVGTVKSRLIPALGEEGATRAHEHLLRHVLSVADGWCQQEGGRGCYLWSTPPMTLPFFDGLLTKDRRRCQPPGDLGQRMAAIAAWGLRRSRGVMLLGGDGASISPAVLDRVAAALQEVPVVMAPADDGGYVLLGLTRVDARLFHPVAWGTDQVAGQTRQCLQTLGWPWREFPGQWDVDRPDDWQRFVEGLPGGRNAPPA